MSSHPGIFFLMYLFFCTPLLTASRAISNRGGRERDVLRAARGASFRMTSLKKSLLARTEQNGAEQEFCAARSLARSQGPEARTHTRGTGPRVYSDGEAPTAREASCPPRHATRIRNEYKYIERRARGTEKERHVVQKEGREVSRVLV